MKYPSKAKEAIRATEMSPVTLAEALSLQDTQRKYGNEKVVINGMTFDSQAEYRRWRELCLMAQAGEIGDLQRQVRYELVPVQRDEDGNVLERGIKLRAGWRDREDDANRAHSDAPISQKPRALAYTGSLGETTRRRGKAA